MAYDYRKRTKSRLARRQSQIFMRRAITLVVLAIAVLFLVVRFGVPLLIKMAVYFSGDQTDTQVGQSNELKTLIAPRLQPMPEATFSASLDVNGFAQAGVNVAVYVNGVEEDEVLVNDNGEFEALGVNLKAGKNRIWAVAGDGKGNKSPESDEVVVQVDNSEPKITIDSPRDGEDVSEEKITVTGLVDEEVSLTINGHFVLQGSDKSFSKSIKLSEGENKIVIEAEDDAGNVAEKELVVNYSP